MIASRLLLLAATALPGPAFADNDFTAPESLFDLREDIQGFHKAWEDPNRAARQMLGQEPQGEVEGRYRAGLHLRESFLEDVKGCPGYDEAVETMSRLHRANEAVAARDIDMAVSTMFFEASEDYFEQEAIAFVILNRWRNGGWPSTLYGVCTERTGANGKNPTGWQFEAQIWIARQGEMLTPAQRRQKREVVCGDKLWSVMRALRIALANSLSDSPWVSPHQHPGYLYYCRADIDGRSTWGSSKPLDGDKEADKKGHQFFLVRNPCMVSRTTNTAAKSAARKGPARRGGR